MTRAGDCLPRIYPEERPLKGPAPSAADNRPTKAATHAVSSDEMLALVLVSLDDDKAEEVLTIDLRGRSAMADHMVIASGRSTRQVTSIAEKLLDRLKQATGNTPRVEGKETGDWVLVDAGDVIVHIFRPEVREFYALEKMWLPTDALSALRQPQSVASDLPQATA